jgi:hypothetical protein
MLDVATMNGDEKWVGVRDFLHKDYSRYYSCSKTGIKTSNKQEIPVTTARKSFDLVAGSYTSSLVLAQNVRMSNLLQPFTDAHKST